jgi:hypothetical protein
MKKIMIGSLVGAVMVFIWNALSWTVLEVHHRSFKHFPAQDTVLTLLEQNMKGSGLYMLPMPDNRGVPRFNKEYHANMLKMEAERAGKPYAMIVYHKEGLSYEPMQYILGFLIQFMAVFAVAVLLAAAGPSLNSFFMRWWIVMLVAFVITLEGPITDHHWIKLPWHYIKVMAFDKVVGWSLCAAWLAWYFKK